MNAPSTQETTALAVASRPQFDLSPQTFEQALEFSKYLADSDLVPKDFQRKPGNCLIAIQWGAELGLKPMQAMQNLAIINGRPSLWGDALLALVRSSPLCEYVIETDDGKAATCRVKRRGEPQEQLRTFSIEDAQKAGLASKTGPWTQYPKRMRQLRARAFALRDVFADVLRGIPMAEELMDTPPLKDMGPAEVVTPAATPGLPAMSQEDFDKRVPKIREFYSKGKTSEDIAAFYGTKFSLSDAQKKAIADLKPANEAQDVTPKVTYAQVADKLNAAQDHEQLAAAATLIAAVADDAQRAELTAIYDRRGDEIAF